MKKELLLILLGSTLILSACGKPVNNVDSTPITEEVSQEVPSTQAPITTPAIAPTLTPTPTPTPDASPIKESEIPMLYSNPDNFVNRSVELTGKVFGSPEYDESGVYFQMFHDIENSEYNTVVGCLDTSLKLNEDDYVNITGMVGGTFEGTNAFGGAVTAPVIYAISVEVLSYDQIIAPALEVKEINKSVKQHGYEVVLEKVEFAEKETRLYITINNEGKANFNLYDFNAKIVQNKKQFEYESNYDANYPEIQTDLMPGVSTSGIICFPSLDPSVSMIVYLDGYSDNYREDFDMYEYEIK